MTMKVVYECPTCRKRYKCEAGYFARLDCKHGDWNRVHIQTYPVKIVGWSKE